jgi:hypothetical protein
MQSSEDIESAHAAMNEDIASAPSAVLSQSGEWDRQFVDDLVAANRFKTFLVARGAPVPKEVLKGLGDLSSDFSPDIDRFIEDVKERSRLPIWRIV